ncbi:MAG: ATP-binding protein [Gammaproteobacteria bacterium]|nr:ATP-binding protein [Gammaproteobacteria bacterium]
MSFTKTMLVLLTIGVVIHAVGLPILALLNGSSSLMLIASMALSLATIVLLYLYARSHGKNVQEARIQMQNINRRMQLIGDISMVATGQYQLNRNVIHLGLKSLTHYLGASAAVFVAFEGQHANSDESIQSYINRQHFKRPEVSGLLEKLEALAITDFALPSFRKFSHTVPTQLYDNLQSHVLFKNHGQCKHLLIPILSGGKNYALISVFLKEGNILNLDQIEFLNTIAGYYGNFFELTDNRQSLNDHIRRLKNSQRVAKVGSWEYSLQNNNTYWSDQVFDIFNLGVNSITPSIDALIELAHFSERRRLRTFLYSLKPGEERTFEYHATKANGEEVVICIRTDGDNKNDNVLAGVIQDVSEQYRLDQLKEDFISTVSHELRTPLTAIKGSLSLIDYDKKSNTSDSDIHLLDIARKNIDRLLFLVNDILDIQKANSGQVELKLQNIDLNNLVTDAHKQMAHYASQYGTEIKLSKPDKPIISSIDSNRLNQVLLNLLSNAVKFSPENSIIELRLEELENKARILIVDTGPGIPDDLKDKVFEKFTQVNAQNLKKTRGTGLGLCISRLLVEKHGGKIGFYSNPIRGTTFYIELDTIDSTPAQLPGKPGQSNPSLPQALVIEDDVATSRHLKAVLQRLNVSVDCAYSTEQADDLLAKKRYDLITIDIMLPDKNGVTYVKEIQANKEMKNVPILIISAITEIMQKSEEAKGVHVYKWFSKPFDIKAFAATIEELTNKDNTTTTRRAS